MFCPGRDDGVCACAGAFITPPHVIAATTVRTQSQFLCRWRRTTVLLGMSSVPGGKQLLRATITNTRKELPSRSAHGDIETLLLFPILIPYLLQSLLRSIEGTSLHGV